MNMRCMYCQTMFGVSREVMLIGLQTIEAEKLTHYDIYCPKCRRANRVERRKLEMANPNWKETLEQMEKERVPEKEKKEKTASKSKAAAKAKKPAAKSKKSTAKKSAAKKKSTPRAKAK